jgi:HD-like signal output (HDOD) protein
LEKVLRRIRRTKDFPTISKFVIEINRKLAENTIHSSASELANFILKDYALTSKLLKLVNSAFYGFVSGKVTTVTRAVVVLGYDNVRLAAASLLLFDHFKSRSEARDLKDAAISSFWCGLIAKEIAKLQGEIDPEEAFICALLHQLGKLLTIFHLPREYKEIRKRVIGDGETEDRAVKQVLGITYPILGAAVARQWSFPERIVKTMARVSDAELVDKEESVDPLCAVANFTHALCDVVNTVNHSGEREAAIKDLLGRYGHHVSVPAKQFKALMSTSEENLRKHAEALRFSVRQSGFISRLAGEPQPAGDEDAAAGGDRDLAAEEREVQDPSEDEAPQAAAVGAPGEDAVPILAGGVQEVSSAMTSAFEINDIALMSLEVIYRALKCQRAILFIHDGRRKLMQARYGLGAGIQELVGSLGFPTDAAAPRDLFAQALKKGKDLVVADTRAAQLRPLLPVWFRRRLDAEAFLFMPVIFKKVIVAAYYVDMDSPGPPVDAREHKYLSKLRHQLTLAIKMGR